MPSPAETAALTYELIGRDGQAVDSPQAAVLAGHSTEFLSLSELSGVRLHLPRPTPVRSVRAQLVGGGTTDTLNSWIRSLQVPPRGALRLEGLTPDGPVQERRYALDPDHVTLPTDSMLIELCLPVQTLSTLTLRFPPGPYALLRVSVSAEPFQGRPWTEDYARDLPAYPPSQAQLLRRGDALAETLLALGEPTVEQVWRLCLPYRCAALIGQPEGPIAAVNWDGGVVVQHQDGDSDRLWFQIDLGDLTAPGAFTRHGLHKGWLPVAEVGSSAGDLTLLQTAFVDLQGSLRVRFEVQTSAATPCTLPYHFQAARTRDHHSANATLVRTVVHEPVPCTQDGTGAIHIGPLPGRLITGAGGDPVDLVGVLPVSAATPGVLDLVLSLYGDPQPTTGPFAASFDEARDQVQHRWQEFIDRGATLTLPDPRLALLWRALLVHNLLFRRGGKMRYGLFPGVYDNGIFGVEEGWNIVAMALYGHPQEAQDLLRTTFADPEFLKKEGQHHQYRNGLFITYALDVYRLTRERDFLTAVWPTVLDSATWIQTSLRSTQVEVDGQRPPHYGLMPKHTYGGDLRDPTYSLYGSSTCWRGLRDAAIIAAELAEPHAADLEKDAKAAHIHMHAAAERIYRVPADAAHPPFLPFRTDETHDEPSSADYYQLFASLVLETALFGWQGRFAHAITDYLETTGRLVMGVARFDQWFGRLGIDAEYTRGVQLCRLHRRQFARFWLGLIGQVGLSCDPGTFVSPETAIVRFTRSDYQDRMRALALNPRRYESDPCSAGTAVMLQYLRYLLCLEERDEDDALTGTLWIGGAVPASWFAPGAGFAATALPTALGQVSLRCRPEATQVVYEIDAERPLRVELFYFDRGGAHKSAGREIKGKARIELPR